MLVTNKRYARIVCLLGGLCALLVLGMLVGTLITHLFPKIKEKTAHQAPVLETVTTPSSTLIRVDPFLLDAPFFWREKAVPEACPERDPMPILVLPHYLPLHQRIQQTLATWKACASSQSIRRIVILSPDHRQRLAGGAATLSASGYATPLGEVMVDELARSLLLDHGIQETAALFRDEHGVGVFPVFLKQAFPESTILPIVISARATRAEVEAVERALRPFLDDGSTLVIVSADFSHYLTRPEADRHDQETAAVLARRDKAFIWAARDAHTDFGRGLWLALQLTGDASFRRLDWVNSADIGGPSARTTSFWFGWWEK